MPTNPSTTAPHALVALRHDCAARTNAASSPYASTGNGDHTGSATTSAFPVAPSDASWTATGCPNWRIWTRPPGYRYASPALCATRSRHRASWCMWTSRNLAASQRAEAGARMVAVQPKTARPVPRGTVRHARAPRGHGAIFSCITRSMTIRSWPIFEILNDEKKETAAGSGSEPVDSSPRPALPSPR